MPVFDQTRGEPASPALGFAFVSEIYLGPTPSLPPFYSTPAIGSSGTGSRIAVPQPGPIASTSRVRVIRGVAPKTKSKENRGSSQTLRSTIHEEVGIGRQAISLGGRQLPECRLDSPGVQPSNLPYQRPSPFILPRKKMRLCVWVVCVCNKGPAQATD